MILSDDLGKGNKTSVCLKCLKFFYLDSFKVNRCRKRGQCILMYVSSHWSTTWEWMHRAKINNAAREIEKNKAILCVGSKLVRLVFSSESCSNFEKSATDDL